MFKTLKNDKKELDNLEFLIELTCIKQRSWRQGCVICLSDEMTGTTCGCGHTEIVVFRPCEHSICINSCFENWMKTLDIQLEPKTIEIQGQIFVVGSQKNTNLDLSGLDQNVKCPTCRSKIEKTFRAEDVSSKNFESIFNVTKHAKDLYSLIFS